MALVVQHTVCYGKDLLCLFICCVEQNSLVCVCAYPNHVVGLSKSNEMYNTAQQPRVDRQGE